LMRRPPADIVPVVSPQARQWEGWHTNLNPAQEPIVVARKPLEGNVARNVLKYGTGALNIGACRVEGKINHSHTTMSDIRGSQSNGGQYILKTHERERLPRPPLTLEQEQAGRYPANFIHDGSEEVLELFESFGKKPGAPYGAIVKRRGGENDMFAKNRKVGQTVGFGRGDTGSAARFFYCAKVSQKDRNGSVHPTVKPVELMRYLVRLVTPPEGLVLDPFAGTGITGEAAHLEGFDYLLIERDPEFVRDIERRLQKYNRAALSVQEPHRDA
jgi:hypothetical protein